MDIEPPEVPLLYSQAQQSQEQKSQEPKPEHKGFFAKLFSASKKKSEEPVKPIVGNPLSKDVMDMPPLPDLPPLPDSRNTDDNTNSLMPPFETGLDDELKNLEGQLPALPDMSGSDDGMKIFVAGKDKKVGKALKGTKKNTKKLKIEKIDETKSFDWSKPIAEQQPFIKESSRNNPDADKLSQVADEHIDDTTGMLKSNILSYTSYEPPELDTDIADAPESPTETEMPLMPKMPVIHPIENKSFAEMDREHKKLRSRLEKSFKKNFKISDVKALLKQYDQKIEQRIRQKEMELSHKKIRVESFYKLLKKKEAELKQLKKYLADTDKLLKTKEATISEMISKEVDMRVKNISKKDKKILRGELLNTISLNNKLKRQLDIIEKDRLAFDKKKEKLLAEEHRILTNSQAMYEHKLAELAKEKHEFDTLKRDSIGLLHRAGAISKELQELKSLKNEVNTDKGILDELIIEDRNIREAVRIAEDNLKKERTDLDKTIFSRYIQWKLGEAKLEDIRSGDIIKVEPVDMTHKVYSVMDGCKEMLDKRDIRQAKILYNQAKALYDATDFNSMEKVLLYNKIRALYSDIQLRSLDVDITA